MRRTRHNVRLIIRAISILMLICLTMPASNADAGPEWEQIAVPGEIREIVDVPGTDGHLYLASSEGVYETLDGGLTWRPRNEGLDDTNIVALAVRFYGLAADPIPSWAVSASGAVYWRYATGAPWSRLDVLDGPSVKGLALASDDHSERLYCSTPSTLFMTELSAKSPRALPMVVAPLPISVLWSYPDSTGGLFAGSGRDLYALPEPASGDAQSDWSKVTSPPLRGNVLSLSADAVDENRLLIGTGGGGVYTVDLASYAVTELSGSLPDQVDVLDVATVSGRGRTWLVAATSGGVFRSPDGGATWLVSGPEAITGNSVRCLAVDDAHPNILFVGTTEGVVRAVFPPSRPPTNAWAIAMVCAGLLGLLIVAIILRSRPLPGWQRQRSQAQQKLDQWEAWNERIGQELQEHLEVTDAMLSEIPSQVRTLAMRRYVDTHRHQDLVLTQEPLAILPTRNIELDILADNWSRLIESLPSEANAAIIASRIIDQVCGVLGFTPLNRQVYRSIVGVMVEAPTLRLALPRQFPIMFMLQPEPAAADVRDMRDMSRALGTTSFFALTIVPNAHPHTPDERRALMATMRSDADDFELLDLQDLVALFIAADPAGELVRMIVSQIDMRLVSPYTMWGPVPDNMFFGRDYEIRAIMRALPKQSLALVGGRKIGKTSVLARVAELAAEMPGIAALRIDCQHVGDDHAFFEALAVATGEEIPEETPDGLRRMLVHARHKRGCDHLVLILDEVGRLLARDAERGLLLFRTFSDISQEGLVHLLVCGERLLNRALHDPAWPLYGNCATVHLGYLSPDEVKRVVVEPMLSLGLETESTEALAHGVAELSACHPNVAQYICQQLILLACARDDRQVRLDDLAAVQASEAFREFLFEIIWGDATTLEKLITVAMAGKRKFARDEVALSLQRLRCFVPGDELDRSLYELCLLAILSRDHDHYTYRAKALSTLLQEPDLRQVFEESLVSALGREWASAQKNHQSADRLCPQGTNSLSRSAK